MSQILDIEENRAKISLPARESIRRISLSLESLRGVGEKSVAIIVRAWKADGASVTESCKGVHYSAALGEMFAYCPGTPREAFSGPVNLEFVDEPAEVSFELLTWPGREPVAAGVFASSAFFVESAYTTSEGALMRTRILKGGGHKFR